jgi:outer membrane protein assembly factor BamA
VAARACRTVPTSRSATFAFSNELRVRLQRSTDPTTGSQVTRREGVRLAIRLSLALSCALLPILRLYAADYQVGEDTAVINAAGVTRESVNFVIAPIPIANPTIGNGLAVAAIMLYELDAKSPASSTAIAAGYTDTESWGTGVLQEANFSEDRWRLSAGAALALANYDLYPSSGAADIHFTTQQRVTGAMAQTLRQLGSRLYAGLRFQRARVVFTGAEEVQELIPPGGLSLDIGGLGIVAEWDSRDHGYQPRTGAYVTLRSNFARDEFGSDLRYDTYAAALNYFRPGIRDEDTLALRLSVCTTTDDTPFFERCQFGSSNDLRGYPVGRYYDDAMYAAQIEYRAGIWKRLSGVVFMGVGAVSAALSNLDTARSLPAVGAGLRYLASPEQRLNVSVDYAIGRDDSAVYVYIGEAF